MRKPMVTCVMGVLVLAVLILLLGGCGRERSISEEEATNLQDIAFEYPTGLVPIVVSVIAGMVWVLRAASILVEWHKNGDSSTTALYNVADLVHSIIESAVAPAFLVLIPVVTHNVSIITTYVDAGVQNISSNYTTAMTSLTTVVGSLSTVEEGLQAVDKNLQTVDRNLQIMQTSLKVVVEEDITVIKEYLGTVEYGTSIADRIESIEEEVEALAATTRQIRDILVSPYAYNPRLRSSISEIDALMMDP